MIACKACRRGEHEQCAKPTCPCALAAHSWRTGPDDASGGGTSGGGTRGVAAFLGFAAFASVAGGCAGAMSGLNNVDNGGSTSAPTWAALMIVLGVVLAIAAFVAWAMGGDSSD